MPCNLCIPYITYILPLAIYKLCQAAELVLPVHYTSLLYKPLQMTKSDYYKFYQKCTCTEYSSILSEAKSSKFFVVLNSQIVQRIRGQSIQARGSFQNGALQKFQALRLTQEDHFWTCKSRGFLLQLKEQARLPAAVRENEPAHELIKGAATRRFVINANYSRPYQLWNFKKLPANGKIRASCQTVCLQTINVIIKRYKEQN